MNLGKVVSNHNYSLFVRIWSHSHPPSHSQAWVRLYQGHRWSQARPLPTPFWGPILGVQFLGPQFGLSPLESTRAMTPFLFSRDSVFKTILTAHSPRCTSWTPLLGPWSWTNQRIVGLVLLILTKTREFNSSWFDVLLNASELFPHLLFNQSW